MMMNGSGWYGGGMMGGWGWVMMFAALAFWIALVTGIVLLVVWAVRRGAGDDGSGSGSRSGSRSGTVGSEMNGGGEGALDILNRRYAAGEIDDEEYDRRRARITGS